MSKYRTSLFDKAITIGQLREAYATAKDWLDGGSFFDSITEARHNGGRFMDENERWFNTVLAYLVMDMETARDAFRRHDEYIAMLGLK